MKTRHLFEERVYLISNAAEAKNSLFRSSDDCKLFQAKIDTYLSPICDILAYNFGVDEYTLVVNLKSRAEIEDFYKVKKGKKMLQDDLIPPSTYIFSQQMANLQSGYAKHYNYQYDRSGSLFCSRFVRELITSEESAWDWISKIGMSYEFRPRRHYWRSDRYKALQRSGADFGKDILYSSAEAYGSKGLRSGLRSFVVCEKKHLQGRFNKPLIYQLDYKTIKKFFMKSMKFLISII